MQLHFSQLLETGSSDAHESQPWSVRLPSEGWRQNRAGVWVYVNVGPLAKFGWKIHVSTTLEDAVNVLATTSEIAFKYSCNFKYIGGGDSFRLIHFKNSNRLQSGKFVSLYPHDEVLTRLLLHEISYHIRTFKGIDVLTDRAFDGSTNVFYRWGAFQSTGRLNAKGMPEELVPNGLGQMVPDVRLPRFSLPEGIVDPFSTKPSPPSTYSPPQFVNMDQFKIDQVLRFTNGGGRYKGVDQSTGLDVVLKEGRPNTGFVGEESAIPRLQREVQIMKMINAATIGLAPSVVKTFSVQGHEYAAIEYLPGTPLSEWIARENPLYSCLHRSRTHVQAYIRRASKVLEAIRQCLARLHELGIAYGDLSVGNVIVDDQDLARFIDFEACTTIEDPVPGLRTPDFCLRDQKIVQTAKERDVFACHCIAISLILRVTTLAEISNHVLQSVTSDLNNCCEAVPDWWYEACSYLEKTSQQSRYKVTGFKPPSMDTFYSRERLRQMFATAALECYSQDRDDIFPVSSASREGAFLSYGSGCSGLLQALKTSGIAIKHDIILKYTESASRALELDLLPLNYDIGIVGLLDTCSILSLQALKEQLAEQIIKRWPSVNEPSLAHGLTGVALALVRQGFMSAAEGAMARALEMAEGHQWEKNGLLYGRAGVIAGACEFNSLLRSRPHFGKIVERLIEEERGQTVRHPEGNSLSLRGEVGGNRLLPYLSDGTAGLFLSMMIAHKNEHIDFVLRSEDAVALAADLGTPFMLEGSLMDGSAGLSVVLELARDLFPDLIEKLPEPGWRRMLKYCLPLGSGIGTLHPRTLKFDLSHSQGSAGMMEALCWFDGLADLNICGLKIPCRKSDAELAAPLGMAQFQ
ncbi:protein kinase domain-containing protein [Rhizobium leguminosarum]|uniref:class III lanthionine synthetase LanKC N-terminal domain-containing protein n=1 Tax=Rhizobium leguminosarum TaxID=384 RepID=UPI003F95AF03